MCCCLKKESFIWGVHNFLFFFIARIMNCRNSPFPRCAMAANLVHCGIESGPKQNNGCWGYCEKKNSMTLILFSNAKSLILPILRSQNA